MKIRNRDVRATLRVSREARKSFENDPRKARQWLIRMGILNKAGTALANRYQ